MSERFRYTPKQPSCCHSFCPVDKKGDEVLFVEQDQFQNKLAQITAHIEDTDDFLALVHDAIRVTTRHFSYVQVRYCGERFITWYVRNGDTVTLLDIASY